MSNVLKKKSKLSRIELKAGRPVRGRFPLTCQQGDKVLHADNVNPHWPDNVTKVVKRIRAKLPRVPEAKLRSLIAQLAAPRPIPDSTDENSPKYSESESGINLIKPTPDGDTTVTLTNFTARIVEDVTHDDGIERKRVFRIEAKLGGKTRAFEIPAAQFPLMNWPIEQLGAGAIVYPGFSSRDHARAAIQTFSTDCKRRTIFTHTGWREVSGELVFLHAGGALGAKGPLTHVEVDLPDAIARYRLPDPPIGKELRRCIRASLAILEVADAEITVPILAAVYRAVLGACDGSVFLAGPTGVCKSELAALACQHFGAGLDRLHLPANWTSTDNSLEGLAFSAKDVLLPIDDFAPVGTDYDVQRMHQKADRVLRAQGNGSARQRMCADGTLRVAKPPRGMILSTGEDVPRGQSLKARIFVLEVGPGDIDIDRLTACQTDGREGRYARAMAAYVQWLAPQIASIQSGLAKRVSVLRAQATQAGMHGRTPELVANLAIGLDTLLAFAVSARAISVSEKDALWARCWRALERVAAKQSVQQNSTEPASRFLELIGSALASGRAHLASFRGKEPGVPAAWGWRSTATSSGGTYWAPQGQRIGWVNGPNVFLNPDASYTIAKQLGGGDGISITPQTLRKRLAEKGFLIREEGRDELTVRRTIEGVDLRVLMLRPGVIHPGTPQRDVPIPVDDCVPEELFKMPKEFADSAA